MLLVGGWVTILPPRVVWAWRGSTNIPILLIEESGLLQGGVMRHAVTDVVLPDEQFRGGAVGEGSVRRLARRRVPEVVRCDNGSREGPIPICLGKLIGSSLVWENFPF